MNEGAGPTVLVIDDDDDIRLLARTILEGTGYSVIDTDSGRSGLDLARQRRADLILLDIHIPDLDAWSFLMKAWEDGKAARIPVVMFSATCDTVSVERARAWGCADFVHKPFSPDELVAAVEGVLKPKS